MGFTLSPSDYNYYFSQHFILTSLQQKSNRKHIIFQLLTKKIGVSADFFSYFFFFTMAIMTPTTATGQITASAFFIVDPSFFILPILIYDKKRNNGHFLSDVKKYGLFSALLTLSGTSLNLSDEKRDSVLYHNYVCYFC